ncbi:NAD(P)H-hydrate dehydratase [Corynebacteriaceae bacterium 7-707]
MNASSFDALPGGRVYTVDRIRRAERPLLDAETEPDQLMRSAAAAVAEAAGVMLQRAPVTPEATTVLLAVGAGGNGGDALYAGALLAGRGWPVAAVLLGRGGRVHGRALEAFREAGGEVLDLDEVWRDPARHRLVVDGVLGMGGDGGLGEDAAVLLAFASARLIPVLSVDVPSGISADTGATPPMVGVTDPPDPRAGATGILGRTVLKRDRVPAHAIADVTVTFGGLRRAHAVNAYCGQVVLANPGLGEDPSQTIGARLTRGRDRGDASVDVEATRAVVPGGEYDFAGTSLRGVPESPVDRVRAPGPYDDKYSGGVVGICAGSEAYPGAAVLTTTAAVRTTSAMVRYVGGAAGDVVRACPEVVWAPTVGESGRVQAWVVGPGRGTGDEAAEELEALLRRPEPVVVDADAVTLLAGRGELRTLLSARGESGSDPAPTVLTPHAGEFRRLAEAVGGVPDPDDDRIGAAVALSRALGCVVLLKGRHTVVTDGKRVTCTDAGTSWAATPGSGDVLAGMTGALVAESEARLGRQFDGARRTVSALYPANHAVALHAVAASVSARTPEGEAPTSASRIAEAIPRARASAGPAYSLRAY